MLTWEDNATRTVPQPRLQPVADTLPAAARGRSDSAVAPMVRTAPDRLASWML